MDSAARVPRLPVAALQSIFEFTAATQQQLYVLARVSQRWHALALDVAAAAMMCGWKVESAVMGLATCSRSGLVELRRQLTLVRSYVTTIVLPPHEVTNQQCPAVSVATWCSILSQAPHLATLATAPDNKRLFLPVRFAPLVAAAAICCPRLKTLSLPRLPATTNRSDPRFREASTAAEVLFNAVVKNLPAWNELRDVIVSVPIVCLADPFASSRRFVSSLATYCPYLETVGFQDLTRHYHQRPIAREEQWLIDVDTWEQFCASCTDLTAFNWSVVPFATSFFEVFGRFPKHKLASLTLARRYQWDWDAYHREYRCLSAGFGNTAQKPEAVLAACPRLRKLVLGIDNRATNKLFGDGFIKAVAEHCPRLEWFETTWEMRGPPGFMRITDDAMATLATLPKLTYISIISPNGITGDGILTLLTSAKGESPKQRSYDVLVGGAPKSFHANAFYDVVNSVLAGLAGCEALPSASEKIVLCLINANADAEANRQWRASYRANLEHLGALITRAHPELRVRAVVMQVDGHHAFRPHDVIGKVCVFTASASVPRHWKTHTRVFVHADQNDDCACCGESDEEL